MSVVVVKNNGEEAWVKVTGSGDQTITMASIAYDGVTPRGAAISHFDWSVEDGEVIHVKRGPGGGLVDIFNLSGSGEMDFGGHGFVLDEYSNTSVVTSGKNGAKNYNIIIKLEKII